MNWAKANRPNTVATKILQMAPPETYPTTGLVPVSTYILSTGQGEARQATMLLQPVSPPR